MLSYSARRWISTIPKPDISRSGNILLTLAYIKDKCRNELPSLPVVVALGNQSSGKTTVLTAMTGLDVFETKENMATKRPVYINVIKTSGGIPYVRIGSFGENIYDINKIRAMMKETNDGPLTDEPVEFSFFTPDTVDARYVDLPGYIAVAGRGHDRDVRQMIERINRPFVEDPNNIKLLIMDATSDRNNSLALAQVYECDQMKNCVGVITKLDKELSKTPNGRDRLIDILSDTKEFAPELGLVGLRLRSSDEMKAGMGIQDMIKREQQFILDTKLDPANCPDLKLGIPILRELISQEQLFRISQKLPEYQHDLTKLIQRTEENQKLLASMSKDADRVDNIAYRMTDTIETMGKHSPQRVLFEKNLFRQIQQLIDKMVDASAKTHFPDLTVSSEVIEKDKAPDIYTSSALNDLRKGYRHIGGVQADVSNNYFHSLTMFGNCLNSLTQSEMQRSYQATTAQGLTAPFYKMQLTNHSMEYRTFWMNQVCKIIDDLIKIHNIPDEVRKLTLTQIVAFVDASANTDPTAQDDASLLFRYIMDKVEENTNKIKLADTLSQLVAAEKRPVLDPVWMSHFMALHKQESFYKHVGLFDDEKYPKYFSVYGTDWTKCYLNELKRQLGIKLYQVVGVNVSDPLLVGIMAHCVRFFQNGNFAQEGEKVTTQLEQFKNYQIEISEAMKQQQEIKLQKEEMAKKQQEINAKTKLEEERSRQKKSNGNRLNLKMEELTKTLIILDWDDTLFPTNWVVKNSYNLRDSYVKMKYSYLFNQLDNKIYILLQKFLHFGEVVIITNATLNWVSTCLEILPKTQNLINNNIDVISARKSYQQFSQYIPNWKKYAFTDMYIKNYLDDKNDDNVVQNIISVGDAEYEHLALVNLYDFEGYQPKKRILKSIRFIQHPDLDTIIDQIDVLTKNINKICTLNKHIDLQFTPRPHQ